jgi:hypothetical protein
MHAARSKSMHEANRPLSSFFGLLFLLLLIRSLILSLPICIFSMHLSLSPYLRPVGL